MDKFGTCSLAALMLVVRIIEQGVVLSTLWNWFLPPLFGFRTLTWVEAVAVSLVLSTLVMSGNHPTDSRRLDSDKQFDAFFTFVAPLITLAIGWVIKSMLF